jgi:vancomycin aglycone glucosyltransferase
LLSTYDSRGGVEPLVGLAVRLRELGAEALVCAPPDVQAPTTESLTGALRTALTPQTRARAAAVAGTIRTDGATAAATLLLDAVSRERPPVPA